MMLKKPVLVAGALAASLIAAPLAHADPHDWHRHGGVHGDWRGGDDWHGDRRGGDWHHHGGGNVGAAIAGGLLGLGLGAAIAGSHPYYAPPPVAYPPYGYGYGYSPYGYGYRY